jgi:hypothetical protein
MRAIKQHLTEVTSMQVERAASRTTKDWRPWTPWSPYKGPRYNLSRAMPVVREGVSAQVADSASAMTAQLKRSARNLEGA